LSTLELGIVSMALGLDAFGVAFSLGLDKRINRSRAFAFILSFGFFQFLFVCLGGLGGNLFNKYIFNLPSLVGGIIILLVGILMFREGLSKEDRIDTINFMLIIVLGICVSIDALIIGFSTFDAFDFKIILFENSVVVGIVTSCLTLLAFAVSRKIRRIHFIKKYADFLGGIILMLFGIKMIFF